MRDPSPAQLAWSSSDRCRAIGAAALRRYNAARHAGPKCGAKARTTGEPCRAPASANGRCHLHGGRTPKGADWHRPRWPKKDALRAVEKMTAKLNDRERAARKRERRLATMTVEEREAHRLWQRTHKPGSPAERARMRQERQQAAEARALLAKPPAAPSAELRAIRRDIEALRAERARIEADSAAGFRPMVGVFA